MHAELAGSTDLRSDVFGSRSLSSQNRSISLCVADVVGEEVAIDADLLIAHPEMLTKEVGE